MIKFYHIPSSWLPSQKAGLLRFISIFADLSHYPARLNTFWQKPYYNILALPHLRLRFGHTKQIFTKTQLHFSQTIPQIRIKSSFPGQQTNCLNVPCCCNSDDLGPTPPLASGYILNNPDAHLHRLFIHEKYSAFMYVG